MLPRITMYQDEPIPFVYDDGGRVSAGFRGSTGDCVVRAISIATGRGYRTVYDELTKIVRSAAARKRRTTVRNGVDRWAYERYLSGLNWKWTPTMAIGTGCTTHLLASELPKGRIIVRLSRHLAAVIDGILHDIYDSSRGGSRCVYGYFSKD